MEEKINSVNDIKKIKAKDFTWWNIDKIENDEIEFLRNNFNFHPLNMRDITSRAQRPKVDAYPHYIFLVMLFPVYDRKTQEIKSAEVDFFIGQDYLITIHNGELKTIIDTFNLAFSTDATRSRYLNNGVARLLYEILDRLVSGCFPMLDHISQDIDKMENGIFEGEARKLVQQILLIKRNIVNFRKIMQTHKNTLKKLIEVNQKIINKQGMGIYFDDLIEQTKEIWDVLENHRETIISLEYSTNTLTNFRINHAMKTLTVFATIIWLLTLVATIFSMDVSNQGFIIIIAIMTALIILMIAVFKKKKLL